MARLTILLIIVLLQIACASVEKDLIGTWISISHQTVTVTHYKNDGTFSGTYFTPAFDVKTTFSGKWNVKGDELVLDYLESSSPVMKVPLQDRNKLIFKDKNTVVLKTLPEGIQVEAKRVKFKDRKEVYPDWGKTTK